MYFSYPPPPSLAHLVRGFHALDDVHTPATEEHRLYPECTVALSFLRGASWYGTEAAVAPVEGVFVQRFVTRPMRLVSRGPTRLVGVELHAWASDLLLGDLDSAEHQSRLVPHELAVKMERLLAAGELDEALFSVVRWLEERARGLDLAPTPAMTVAMNLRESGGGGSILALADAVDLSVRQLERQFKDLLGVTPKTLARMIRFEKAHQTLWHAPDTRLTTLAHDLGYADQAHFCREFRELAQKTPSAYVAEVRAAHRRRGHIPARKEGELV